MDIVERLRSLVDPMQMPVFALEAADEIERLREQLFNEEQILLKNEDNHIDHYNELGNMLGQGEFETLEDAVRRVMKHNAAMRAALLTIQNIALMDSGHWAKTIEATTVEVLQK